MIFGLSVICYSTLEFPFHVKQRTVFEQSCVLFAVVLGVNSKVSFGRKYTM